MIPDSGSIREIPIAGGWRRETIELEDQRFVMLLPADPDAILEEAVDQGVDASPYWAAVWPAAFGLARAILKCPELPASRALELGTGCGLTGLAALARGCRVHLTDVEPLSVRVAAANARNNGFEQFRADTLDWHQPPRERYPWIFAADVTHNPDEHLPLLAAIEQLLDDGGCCWIGDPGRHTIGPFLEKAASRFAVTLFTDDGTALPAPVPGKFVRAELRRTSPAEQTRPAR